MHQSSRRLLLCAVALALAAVACSSASSLEARRVQRRDVKVVRNVVHPLTGESLTGGAWQQRPALAVKVGNTIPERPQAGLDKADVIYEELVEGGMTRFMAIFSSQDASRVGPVRSARKVDPSIFAPITGLFGYSGAAPSVLAVVGSGPGLTDVGINRASSAYHRDGNRNAPYNLYTSTRGLWSGRKGSPPEQLFDFVSDASTGGTPAKQASLSFNGAASTIRYVYNTATGRYTRYIGQSAHTVEGPKPLEFRNIVVQTVRTSAGSSVDKAGFHTTDIQVTGSGEAVVIRGGRVLRGRWERNGNERTRFIDATGQPLRLAPGNTIVELLPQGKQLTVS